LAGEEVLAREILKITEYGFSDELGYCGGIRGRSVGEAFGFTLEPGKSGRRPQSTQQAVQESREEEKMHGFRLGNGEIKMKSKMLQIVFLGIIPILPLLILAGPSQATVIADHIAATQFDSIPHEIFQDVREQFRIFFGHTSHGSQIITGISMLGDEHGANLASPLFHEIADDLGYADDVSWVQPTRDWLDGNPDYNVVMWSWCGGMSTNTIEGVNTYLQAMSELEAEYPGVVFVYMTGHLDGSGVDGNLYRGNNQIRDYCEANNKVLFDFADIESWDPDGLFYPDETDACGWCSLWCAANECPGCSYCAHSHCYNCYLKGKGFWWMMARVAGWEGVDTKSKSLGGLKSLFR
jgi:hypothetical protein